MNPLIKFGVPERARCPASFSLSAGAQGIATVDADGVALAAIQGLNQKLTKELKRRDAENAELKQRLEALETIVLHHTSN
jgi:hypothetical protein